MSQPLTFLRGHPKRCALSWDWLQAIPFPGGDIPQETNWNWSGGVIRPTTPVVFSAVEGRWTGQAPQAPPPNPMGLSRFDLGRSFDGHDPTSPAMPQIGTLEQVVVIGGVVTKKQSTRLVAMVGA